MATQSGATFDLKKFDLVIGGGFRVDALDAGGVVVAWIGVANTVTEGADNINVRVRTGSTNATVTVNNMQSARFIDYVSAWVDSGDARVLSIQDRTGRTVLAEARAAPEQKPGMTFTNSHQPRTTVILCPNLEGTVGGLLDG
jgi:hypothetical protein